MLYSMMAERQSKRIAAKRACQCDPSPPAVPHSKKKAKTNYKNVKACIERMKQNNSKKYEAYKENMKNASRLYQQNMSEEQRSRAREQAKIRMQNYRQRQLELNGTASCGTKTRASISEQQKKWQEQKQRQRDKISHQKHTAMNKIRRDEYKEKKMNGVKNQTSVVPEKTTTPESQVGSPMVEATTSHTPPRTPAAKRQCLLRVKSIV